MIRSEVKKKIEASATITNTIMVVMVVSRRVGQVTLAVSERTSCRNLNGLKAIVDVIRRVRRFSVKKESEQPSCATPSSRRMIRQAGSVVRGISRPRGISFKAGRQQVAGMYCGRGQRSSCGGTARQAN